MVAERVAVSSFACTLEKPVQRATLINNEMERAAWSLKWRRDNDRPIGNHCHHAWGVLVVLWLLAFFSLGGVNDCHIRSGPEHCSFPTTLHIYGWLTVATGIGLVVFFGLQIWPIVKADAEGWKLFPGEVERQRVEAREDFERDMAAYRRGYLEQLHKYCEPLGHRISETTFANSDELAIRYGGWCEAEKRDRYHEVRI